jgi:hypothetical protein
MIIWVLDRGLLTLTDADWDRLYRCDYDELVAQPHPAMKTPFIARRNG